MSVLDTTGTDIGPLVQDTAAEYGIPAVGLLALLKAESGLNPNATRKGVWPDWSVGLGQCTVQLARSYGIGDGTPSSWPAVVAALCDRAKSIRVAADYYRFCLHNAEGDDPSLSGDAYLLGGMYAYNAGHYPPPGDSYYTAWASNVASYKVALAWAHGVIGPA